MAESIEMLFGLRTRVGPEKQALHCSTHWRHLANTIELSMWKTCRYTTLWNMWSTVARCFAPPNMIIKEKCLKFHFKILSKNSWNVTKRYKGVTFLVKGYSGLLDGQPAGEVSHKPISRLTLLSTRPAVTFPASVRHQPWPVPIYTDWWTESHACERFVCGHLVTEERQAIEPACSRPSIRLDH